MHAECRDCRFMALLPTPFMESGWCRESWPLLQAVHVSINHNMLTSFSQVLFFRSDGVSEKAAFLTGNVTS